MPLFNGAILTNASGIFRQQEYEEYKEYEPYVQVEADSKESDNADLKLDLVLHIDGTSTLEMALQYTKLQKLNKTHDIAASSKIS